MAIHLNLYHEIQTQNLQRKRDPLRLGMLVILVIGIVLVMFYFYRLQGERSLKLEATRLQEQWDQLAPKEKAAQAREQELLAMVKLKDSLIKRIEDRCLWGPILELISQAVPREVQIRGFDVSKAVLADKSVQLTFTLSGIASGSEGRKAAEDFRVLFLQKLSGKYKNVSSMPKDGFRVLEDREEKVFLNGQNYATAAFVVSYVATVDSGEAPAAPVRVRTR